MTSPLAAPDAGAGRWPSLNSAERSALREILVHGPLSRAEIARRLGASRTSLTRVIRVLVEHGLVAEGAFEVRGATGRPSELLHIHPDSRHFLGVKLTGATLYAVVTDLTIRVVATYDEPLTTGTVEDTVGQICDVRDRLQAERLNIVAAGVCLAGDVVMSKGHQVVMQSPFLGWREVRLAELLSERLGVPAAAENDVRALTATEHWFGAGAGCDSLALVTVGQGLGFGFVVNGSVVTGAHGRAGRLDHLMIDPNGPTCEYGHRGCVSAYLTTPAIVGALRTPGLDHAAAVALARSGDPAAVRVFRDAGHALGFLVAMVANTFDPEKIVLTGPGIAVTDIARTELDAAIEAHKHPDLGRLSVDIQTFEFTEWARAAAVLAIRNCLRF